MCGVAREENETDVVSAGGGKSGAGFLRDLDTEGVRHLHEDAGAVTGVELAAGGTAVVAVFEHLDISAQNGVRGSFLEVGDKTDSAVIVLQPPVVKPLLGGTGRWRRSGKVRRRDEEYSRQNETV